MRRAPVAVALALVLALAAGAEAEVFKQGHLRVSFEGRLTPQALPRHGSAPVEVEVGGRIATDNGGAPPQLRRFSIAINGYGSLHPGDLPVCRVEQIQPATTEGALEACRSSLVGEGSFSAQVLLPRQAPFPSAGKVYAFNGTFKGQPAILAHVYGTHPVPTSYTLPFRISRLGKGRFGTLLSTSLPQVTSEWGHVTGLVLKLRRTVANGHRGYVSAGCPAPDGFPGASFPLARATFAFAGGLTMRSTIIRNCRARG